MFEFLLEFSEMNTLDAIYTGIILGLAIKYVWSSIKYEYWDSTSFTHELTGSRIHSPKIILKKYATKSNLLVNWIIQIVRRKENPSDETDSIVFP
ncbi:hypothetical protein [Neobacillus sp. D3-1R]|uniref:hypothetical protein n=1 Tax=Neobacillus sp. D3-1R TaxID=3445778 RepID=UPI003F9FAF6B